MATVGRNLAVVDIPKPKLHFGGFFAWLIWMSLHLFLILGVKNRIMIFINWIYNYFTYDQNLRLIFREFYRPRKKELAKQSSTVPETSREATQKASSSPRSDNDDSLRQAAGFKR